MLTKTFAFLKSDLIKDFLADETGGEKDNINTLLILALIVLPLVFLIITFGKKAKQDAKNAFDSVAGNGVGFGDSSGGGGS